VVYQLRLGIHIKGIYELEGCHSKIHEASKCHKEGVLKMVTLPSSTQNVAGYMSRRKNWSDGYAI